MIKTARQLKDLIRNLSKDKSADAQILMRNYMMERFLERISLSEYRDKFILKGGMLVAAMVGLDARSTMDIDATVKGATVGIEEVENMIASIISVPVDDGVEFRVKRISEILETVVSRATTNTRMRDFYDIYILEQLHGNTLDPQILHDALRATAHKRGTERHLAEAAEVFEEVENSSVMQKLWESYRKKFSYAADLEWNIIMGAVRSLYALSEKESSL